MLPGLAGRFFAPLGLAYVLAILASLAVAMIVTPALCMLLFRQRTQPGDAEPCMTPGHALAAPAL